MLLAVGIVCGLLLAGCGDQGTGTKPVTEKKGTSVTPATGGGTTPATGGGSGGTAPVVAKHPWGNFKKGSFVTMKTTSVTKMANMDPMTSESEMTQTLTDLDADNATVEMKMKVAGADMAPNSIKMPLKATGVAGAVTTKPKDLPDEKLTVAGKTLNCKVTEMETKQGNNTSVTKMWRCEDVPGFTVKTVTKMTGDMEMESTMELTAFEVK
jgi:hypothetical protein